MPLPEFLIKRIPKQENIRKIRRLLDDYGLHTVCESAKCPNIGECFSKRTLTFMILGNVCTRHCQFCGVDKGTPLPLDAAEPKRTAEAAKKLGLNYVVVTSVARDDLPDGGASQFAETIQALRLKCPAVKVEVLIPDFQGEEAALKIVLDAHPHVLNHNLETVPRLYPAIRPQANYQQSLALLQRVKRYKRDTSPEQNRGVYTKSGFMVGLGENREEIIALLKDLRKAECDIVTIGQYLPPSKTHPRAERYVLPEEFEELQVIGKGLGFLEVFSGPFIRSSYRAGEISQWKKRAAY